MVTFALFALLIVAASLGGSSIRLDLSCRPLFVSSPELAAPTEEFEQVFGQSSGAWVTAIVENRRQSSTEFIRSVDALSDSASAVPGISEVMSLTTAQVPQWNADRLSFARPIPEYLLDPAEDEELQYQFDDLLAGSRFVDWLVSDDGRYLLVAGRLDAPLRDIEARRVIVQAFQDALDESAPAGVRLHYSGVSVVELAYERQVLVDQITATVLATAGLMLILLATFGDFRLVLVCLTPVTFAIPATLGMMGWFGYPVTIINTAIPAVILVIGVADAVHMLNAWLEARSGGSSLRESTDRMLASTGKACFFTTVTTMGGFLALMAAELESVGIFGFAAATGILAAWLGNQIVIPWVMRRLDAGEPGSARHINRLADGLVTGLIRSAAAQPRRVLAASALFAVACVVTFPYLNVDQKFNEELPPEHDISLSQALLEDRFAGFLGPEVSIYRSDGGSMVTEEARESLTDFVAAVRGLPDVDRVWSVLDLVPRSTSLADWPVVLEALREAPSTSRLTSELINTSNDHLAVIIRLGDIGTARAEASAADIARIAAETLGDDYDVEVVGQWWLAQQGMQLLLRDMLTSLATAMLIVGPLLWIALREWRLFFAASIANVLPLLLPLAFMAVTGITLRIGTAVVLAIALGIVVDNSLHVIIRLRKSLGDKGIDSEGFDEALRGTGRAVLFTTLALVAGFLSMLANDLLAIRDMGLVAAVTIAGAMIADLVVLPAVYVLMSSDQSRKPDAKIAAAPSI